MVVVLKKLDMCEKGIVKRWFLVLRFEKANFCETNLCYCSRVWLFRTFSNSNLHAKESEIITASKKLTAQSALFNTEKPIFRATKKNSEQRCFSADSQKQRWSMTRNSELNNTDSDEISADHLWHKSVMEFLKQRCLALIGPGPYTWVFKKSITDLRLHSTERNELAIPMEYKVGSEACFRKTGSWTGLNQLKSRKLVLGKWVP